jgi:hypothetical protein
MPAAIRPTIFFQALMNAPLSDTDSLFCPVCHRLSPCKSPKLLAGLLTCSHCRAHLVVSWSGHYVRDPFTLKQYGVEQSLRRRSRPVARIWRDLGVVRSTLLFTLVMSTALVGFSSVLGKFSIKLSDPPQPPFELPKAH